MNPNSEHPATFLDDPVCWGDLPFTEWEDDAIRIDGHPELDVSEG
jgi:hypothetical protein